MNERLYQIALTKIPKVGAVTAKNLISYCGGVEAVFKAKKRNLLKIPGIGEGLAQNILQQNVLQAAEVELQFMEQNDIQAFFYLDAAYPQRLRHYPDSPVMLYYKGTADLNHPRIISIVGTRKPSVHGISFCEELISDLTPYNPLILSGLAYGIDVTAHKQSLTCGLPTVGVMASGIQYVYPPPHRRIANQMIGHGGLLTEYPSDVEPDSRFFPMRNRIVAGLCDAVVVVETARKGGSMITAKYANDYNKDVFAVPGRVRDSYAKGCNLLIKSHRAALLESAEDIAYVMRWEKTGEESNVQRQLFVDLNEQEKVIVDLLRGADEMGIDRLIYESKLNGSAIASLLLNLEFKGVVKTLPGKRYVLVH